MASLRPAVLVLFIVFAVVPCAFAGDWSYYNAPMYGFSMLVPDAATIRERDIDGWGGIYATFEGVRLWGLAKRAERAAPEDIEEFGARLTGIPGAFWDEEDSGAGNGWIWHKTVKARQGDKIIYGGYGAGLLGSYLMLIETTEDDFMDNEADYMSWYDSIKLY